MSVPVRIGDRTITEGVRAIRWSGGALPSALVDGFAFRARIADGVEGPFHFPAVQGCGTAEAAWTEIPASGQDPHALRRPAPALRLAQAGGAPVQHGARTYRVGSLVIEAPWTRATPQGARVGGGYMRITNTGTEADRLTGGSATVAGRFEVHEMSVTDGVMRMRPLAQGLEIAPGQTVELRPGGYHVMFMELREGLREGGTVRGTLVFQRAGTVEVEYRVGPIGGGAPGGGHSHH
jgi:copper(I)-binding protein